MRRRKYDVGKAITFEKLKFAYEVWYSTELTIPQVARALRHDPITLKNAFIRAERQGIYGYCKKKSLQYLVGEYVAETTGVAVKEIAVGIGKPYRVTCNAVNRAYNAKLIRRRKRISTDNFFIYY